PAVSDHDQGDEQELGVVEPRIPPGGRTCPRRLGCRNCRRHSATAKSRPPTGAQVVRGRNVVRVTNLLPMRRLSTAVVAVALVLLPGCGDDGPAAPPSPPRLTAPE